MADNPKRPLSSDHPLYATTAVGVLIGVLVEKGVLKVSDVAEYNRVLEETLSKMGQTFNA
ncbi:hypothetical protein ASE73_02750 [Sphingomonas sp. Leaf24]|uniref:hypothetical protein n=1 Tax=unclassified Sphingomonas TaxID=196159 RepID=UPI0006FE6603|nr:MULTISPECIES: hypothetical protein [unclassified Sphingomonas]KQM23161.1 hypothetical protein ASE50_02750 [Sphingomonas sp. Leaf5]KQM96019.1 hypothetical protein ASE73_02750 [Sphingomonas sp. Leaf24]